MQPNGYLLAFHLTALFLWLGNLLGLSRYLGYHVEEPHDQWARFSAREKRMWLFIGLPGMLLVLVTGMMLLHGVSSPTGLGVKESLMWYLDPRNDDGSISVWYVTFHVKLVSFVLLVALDFWVGRQIFVLARGQQPSNALSLPLITALPVFVVTLMAVWLTAMANGMDIQVARYTGMGVAAVVTLIASAGAWKLGTKPGRHRYMYLHAVIAALLILILILVLARPLTPFGLL